MNLLTNYERWHLFLVSRWFVGYNLINITEINMQNKKNPMSTKILTGDKALFLEGLMNINRF